MTLQETERMLVQLGGTLVVLAMTTGLLIGLFPEVELILSAHVAANTAGIFMIAVGGVVGKLALSDSERRWLVRALAGSGYLNWAATLLGAWLKTNRLTPVHGEGGAGLASEAVVAVLLGTMVACTFVSLGLLLRGTRAPSPAAG